jgi:diaminohydroxyphosphoribosylaminopyrimidine deaminase/5-amino-6-(5-phosphoribosylamino)uracil reductase
VVFSDLLQEAGDLARGGLLEGMGWVAPNPMVGALALQRGQVVGKGLHRVFGQAHAEEEALQDAQASGASPDTLVVTLEPCSSKGGEKKRPPCTETILASTIQRVVVGLLDPDPRHQGQGLQLLREAGLEVLGPFPSQGLQDLLRPFLKALALSRPWMIAKWAMSLDGKTATKSGSSTWISGDLALDFGHRLRASCDGVMVGYRTALLDRPQLSVRRVQGPSPSRIVIDPHLQLPLDLPLFQTDEIPTVVLYLENMGQRRNDFEKQGVCCVPVPSMEGSQKVLNFSYALELLREEGMRRILVEGGGRSLAQLMSQACVDQCLALISPKLVGGRDAATPLEGEGVKEMDQAMELCNTYHFSLGNDLGLGGYFL